jgi:triacylglycerol esterase/lipase EstA (alpha/beta hydrolase family)
MKLSSERRDSHSAVARLQLIAVSGLFSAVALSAGLIGPSHPWLAVAAGIAVLAVPALVLGLEFLLLPWRSKGDPVSKPALSVLLSAWVCEIVQYLFTFVWRQPFRWRAIPDRLAGDGIRGRRGVILVHGFCCNRGLWNPWLRRLAREHRAFVAVNLEPIFGSIDRYNATLDDALSRVEAVTGLPPLVVCHSMGGLAVRAWLAKRQASGVTRGDGIHRVVTIGSPHHGTWLARFSPTANARQMREGSDWLHALAEAWKKEHTGVPRHRFTCWYSNADNIVMPPSSATLYGADNRLIHGVGHITLAQTAEVMNCTLAYLDESH